MQAAPPGADGALLLTSLEQEFLDAELALSYTAVQAPAGGGGDAAAPKPGAASSSLLRARHPSGPSNAAGPAAAHSSSRSTQTLVPSVPASGSRLGLLKDLQELEAQLAAVLAAAAGCSDDAGAVAQRLCRSYNHTAMQLLEVEDVSGAMALLEKAQVLCDGASSVLAPQPVLQRTLLATTLSNMACCHHRGHECQAAIKLLTKALGLTDGSSHMLQKGHAVDATASRAESDMELSEAYAGVQLNMCAVLSSLHRHAQAIECACQGGSRLCAAWGLQREALLPAGSAGGKGRSNTRRATELQPPLVVSEAQAGEPEEAAPSANTEAGAASEQAPAEAPAQPCHPAADAQPPVGAPSRRLTISASNVLAACLYNEAVQHEHLGQLQEAQALYWAAADTAARLLGRTSSMARLFRQSLQAFKSKMLRHGGRPAQHTPQQHGTIRHQQRPRPRPDPSLGAHTEPGGGVAHCRSTVGAALAGGQRPPWDDSKQVCVPGELTPRRSASCSPPKSCPSPKGAVLQDSPYRRPPSTASSKARPASLAAKDVPPSPPPPPPVALAAEPTEAVVLTVPPPPPPPQS